MVVVLQNAKSLFFGRLRQLPFYDLRLLCQTQRKPTSQGTQFLTPLGGCASYPSMILLCQTQRNLPHKVLNF